MELVDIESAVTTAFDSIQSGRLAVLTGAGLSMTTPSLLPSAAELADRAKRQYEAINGPRNIPGDLEGVAEWFRQRGELQTVFIRRLLGVDAFAGPHNMGHTALADLMVVNALRASVTTNVDVLTENAGNALYATIPVALDGREANEFTGRVPLLKLHGCISKDRDNTVWVREQLDSPPTNERIDRSRVWLAGKLLDGDLLIVGFWSDWDYLNELLLRALADSRPSRVIVVNPLTTASLADRAPGLFALAESADAAFHVQASGSVFLDALRLRFSSSYVRQLLHQGAGEFELEKGIAVDPSLLEPPAVGNDALWRIRRDAEGRRPTEPAVLSSPQEAPTLALTILRLRHAGAVARDHLWDLRGRSVRVIAAGYQQLHSAQARHERDVPQVITPDVVIAVGAENSGLPHSVARADTAPTILRGSSAQWLTRTDAYAELAI